MKRCFGPWSAAVVGCLLIGCQGSKTAGHPQLNDARAAVEKDDDAGLGKLIAQDPELTSATYKTNTTLLMDACAQGSVKAARLLLEKKADPNAKERGGMTPLIFCACSEKTAPAIEIAKLLIEKGANLENYDDRGSTALIQAAGRANLDLIRYLVKSGAKLDAFNETGGPALVAAAGLTQPTSIELLLQLGARVDQPDHDGMTALMFAARTGSLDCIKALLNHKANPNVVAHVAGETVTALGLAEKAGNPDAAELLVKAGAKRGG